MRPFTVLAVLSFPLGLAAFEGAGNNCDTFRISNGLILANCRVGAGPAVRVSSVYLNACFTNTGGVLSCRPQWVLAVSVSPPFLANPSLLAAAQLLHVISMI